MASPFLLGLLAAAAGVQEAEDPLQQFLLRHGPEAAQVEASSSRADDAAFARKLLAEATTAEEDAAYRALLCELAYRFGLAASAGHSVSEEAMRLLPGLAVERRPAAEKRLDALAIEHALPELQKLVNAAHGAEKAWKGERLLGLLLDLGDQRFFDGQRRAAADSYQKARGLAAQLKDPRLAAITARLEAVKEFEKCNKEIRESESAPTPGPDAAQKALRALRFRLAFAEPGRDLAPLLAAAGGGDELAAVAALARRPLAGLSAEECLRLGVWFAAQAGSEKGLLAAGLLARAERCCMSVRRKRPQALEEAEAREIESIEAHSARLEEEGVQAVFFAWIRQEHAMLGSDPFSLPAEEPEPDKEPASKYGGRFTRGAALASQLKDPTAGPLEAALDWLARHQEQRGEWRAAGFERRCRGDKCAGSGKPANSLGVTGLALLALIGGGSTLRQGPYRENVQLGLKWLLDQQQEEGYFQAAGAPSFCMYSHLIACAALCEACGLSGCADLKEPARRALEYTKRARNPYKAWRYGPRCGEDDTSVTCWAVAALAAARSFGSFLGLEASPEPFRYAVAFLDEMTDPETGRVGYMARGSVPFRQDTLVKKFPAERSESLTAAALLARFLAGQDPGTTPVMALHAELLAKRLPAWNPADGSIDMYYWYWGSLAMFQMGGNHWKTWWEKLAKAAVDSQVKGAGCARGSWEPCDPWGEEGGRVYATALMALCLETPYRYSMFVKPR